ncbi:MAG: hypothetical protein EXX96DRAFT_183506 [Benjaminiella poitrasii]|nr:MAG: hypothetical protein EXX96DRAFT_183506 [Benjaminiella poitrasii]
MICLISFLFLPILLISSKETLYIFQRRINRSKSTCRNRYFFIHNNGISTAVAYIHSAYNPSSTTSSPTVTITTIQKTDCNCD